MAFGQAAGPPASAKQLAALAALLTEAGYASFREARHPFGLTQRQANGKFTQDEAVALVERLEAAAEVGLGLTDERVPGDGVPDERMPGEGVPDERVPGEGVPPETVPDEHVADRRAPRPRTSRSARPSVRSPERGPGADAVVTAFPDELLAEELVRRGWTCQPPP